MDKNINDVKIDIVKKAILLGWVVTAFENNTIVIKKSKLNMNNFEKNTELLLAFLVDNNDYDLTINKKYSTNKANTK